MGPGSTPRSAAARTRVSELAPVPRPGSRCPGRLAPVASLPTIRQPGRIVQWLAMRTTMARTMGLTFGTKLGSYEVQSPLGAGGMGEVYRARDTRLDRIVAIKILPAHLCSS